MASADNLAVVANGYSSETKDCDESSACHLKKHINQDIFAVYKSYQAFYKDRLQVLETNCDNDSETSKEEIRCLRNYLEQLEELNSVLMTTVMELQKEVEERVVQMEKRLKSSAKTTMEAVINLHDCEKEMSRLVNEREHLDSLLTDMRCQFQSVNVENNMLKDQNCNLAHDIQALLHVIQHARSTGHWEMDCVTFCEVTPEQVFGPVQSLDNFNSHYTDSFKVSTADCNGNKCPSAEDQSSSTESLPTCRDSLNHGFSVPMLQSCSATANLNRKSSKSDTLCFSRTEEKLTKPFGLRHVKQTIDKSIPSCSTAHRSCYDSFMRKAFSEPHLFIFGDNVYVYKPCENALNYPEGSRSGLHGCPSMDMKLPLDDLGIKHSRMHRKHMFYNSRSHNASSLPCNMEQISLSSCTSDSVDMENSLVIESGEMLEDEYIPEGCECSSHSHGTGKISKCSWASCQVQTEKEDLCSIGIQADVPYVNSITSSENCTDSNVLMREMRVLKDNLLRAEDKVCAQNILVKELQTHLNSTVGEIEGKENEIKELKCQEKVLQKQKRTLMIRLDSEGDELESKKNELEAANHLLQEAITQNQQQTVIIKSLQDALVQSKRALDERNPVINNNRHLGNPSKNYQSQQIQTSRSSIVDL